MRAALLLLTFALCGMGARAEGITDGALRDAISGARELGQARRSLVKLPPTAAAAPLAGVSPATPPIKAPFSATPTTEAMTRVMSGASAGGQFMTTAQQNMAGVKSGLSAMSDAAMAAYKSAGVQAEAALAAFEAQYCTPATFTPSEWALACGCRAGAGSARSTAG